MAGAALLAAVALLAAHEGTLVLGDRSEMRVRDAGFGPHLDLETTPSAQVTYRVSRHTSFFTAAFPRVTIRDDGDYRPDLFAAGQLGAEYHYTHVRLFTLGEAGYGEQSFAGLALPAAGTAGGAPAQGTPGATPGPTPLPQVQALPSATALLFQQERVTLGSQVQPWRRWTFTTTIAYGATGGADEVSRAAFPLQYGPRADATLDCRTSRVDNVATIVTAQKLTFSPGPLVEEGDVQEQWRHRFSRRFEGDVGAGASLVSLRFGVEPAHVRPHPLVDVGLTSHFGFQSGRVDARLSLRVSPFIDRLTGLVDERTQLFLLGTWRADPWTTRLQLGYVQSVPPTEVTSASLLQGELAVGRVVAPSWTAEAGVRAAVQRIEGQVQGNDVFSTPVQVVFFVAMNYREPRIHF